MPRFAVLFCLILVVLPALQVTAEDSESSHVFGVRGARLGRRAIPASVSELPQAQQPNTSLATGASTPDSQSDLSSEDPVSSKLVGSASPLIGLTSSPTPDNTNAYTAPFTPAANVNGSAQSQQPITGLATGSPTPDSQSSLSSEEPASSNPVGSASPLIGLTSALTPDNTNAYNTTSTPAANVNDSTADPGTLFSDPAKKMLPTSQTSGVDYADSLGNVSANPNSEVTGISPASSPTSGDISLGRPAFPDASNATSSMSASWAKVLEKALNASITALPGLEKFAPQIQDLIGEQVDDTLQASTTDPNVQELGHSAGKNASLALGGEGSINVTNKVSGEGEMQGHYENGTACEADAYITLSATSLTTLSGLFVATRELEEVVSRDGTEKHTTLVEKIKAAISFSMLSVIKIVATPQVTECQVAPSETVFTSRIQANMTVIGQMIAELKQDVNGSSSLNVTGGLGVKSGVKAEVNLTQTVNKTLRRCTPEERLMKLGAPASAKLLGGLGVQKLTQKPTTPPSDTQLSYPTNQTAYPTNQTADPTNQTSFLTDKNSYPANQTPSALSQTTSPTTEASKSVPASETPRSMNYFQHRRSLDQNASQQVQADSPLNATSNSTDLASVLGLSSDPSTSYAPQNAASSSPVQSNSTNNPTGDTSASSGIYPSQSEDSPTMAPQTPDVECSLEDDESQSDPDEDDKHTENHVPNQKEALKHVERCYNATLPTVTGVCSSVPKEGPSGVHLGESPENKIKVNIASYVQTGSTVIFNFINKVNGGSGARTDDDDDTTPCEICNHHNGLWRGKHANGGSYPGSGIYSSGRENLGDDYPSGEDNHYSGYPSENSDERDEYPVGETQDYPGGEAPNADYPSKKTQDYPGGKEAPTDDYPSKSSGDYPGGKDTPTVDYPGSKEAPNSGYPGEKTQDYPGDEEGPTADYPGGKALDYPGGKDTSTADYSDDKEASKPNYPGGKNQDYPGGSDTPTTHYPGGKEDETENYPGGKQVPNYPSGNQVSFSDYPGGKNTDGGLGQEENYPGGKSEQGADYPGGGSQMLDVAPPTPDRITSPNGSLDEGTPKLGGGSSEQEKCVCGPDRKTHLRIRSLEAQLATVHRVMQKRGLTDL